MAMEWAEMMFYPLVKKMLKRMARMKPETQKKYRAGMRA